MSLLTIANSLALNVGLQQTDQVISSPLREWQEVVEMANRVGEEMVRRVDWGELFTDQTLVGTGANATFVLNDFSRLGPGITVTAPSGDIVRPLTRAEWASLTPYRGDPRYFLLEGDSITLWPFMAIGETAQARGQSNGWTSSGGRSWSADTETALFSEEVMLKGLLVRWRRQKGMEYADYEAEYEAALADYARFNDRSRL